jgi:hypothetical protein
MSRSTVNVPGAGRELANLHAAAHACTAGELEAGRAWYPEAWRVCRRLAREHGSTPRVAAGVIAALSPRERWWVNVRNAGACLAGGKPGALSRSVAQAEAIRDGGRPLDVLTGPKTRAFYRAIVGDRDAICVDTWAALAAGWERGPKTAREYAILESAYATTAAYFREAPRDLQAAIWCHVRGSAE